jgi:hypothetical protein
LYLVTHGRDRSLQAFQVVFLWLHDWIPVGRLNDVVAVRGQDTTTGLVLATLINSVPFTIGLAYSLLYFERPYPRWLLYWLWISYGVIFLGELLAWWIPYFFRAEPQRAARYQVMFGNTHSFLPRRNGIAPNTAHVLLHLATLATLVCLLLRELPSVS